jgi:hypothetical protein
LSRAFGVAALSASALLVLAAPCSAEIFTVSNNNDAGMGSLRAAVDGANSNGSATTDQVVFATTGNIFLQTQLPTVLTPTTIVGPGPGLLAIRGNTMTDRMWGVFIDSGEVRIENLTIADSRATTTTGAALIKDGAGLLVLDSVVFSGNFGLQAAAVHFSSGLIRIANSTFSGNDSDQFGGAISGGATAQLEIINSTIAGNRADDNGGGIHWNSSGMLTVLSSTVAGNTANDDNAGMHTGGGIYNAGAGTTVRVADTLLANNALGTTTPVPNQCAGAYTSPGYNLRSSADVGCTGFTGAGDIVNPNPLIGTLGPNGGATNTIPLLTGSPAINAGNPATVGGAFPACPATDQRGQPRGGAAGVCDIGAFEVQPTPPQPPQPRAPIPLGAAAASCNRKPATIIGTDGANKLSGTPGADVIAALGGNDKVSGLAGNDVICGGGGKDSLNGGKGNDKLFGQQGKDTLKGGPGKDKLKGGSGKDEQVQ